MADRILQEGEAALIALGRPLLAGPLRPQKVRAGKENEIVFCPYCHTCSREMKSGRPISCPQNPDLGKETR